MKKDSKDIKLEDKEFSKDEKINWYKVIPLSVGLFLLLFLLVFSLSTTLTLNANGQIIRQRRIDEFFQKIRGTYTPTPTYPAQISPTAPSPAADNQKAKGIVAALQKDYVVQYGKVYFFTIEDCAKLTVGQCFGNNPDSPYGLFLLPPGPGEERSPEDVMIQLPSTVSNGGQLQPNWKLRSDEAIVFIGKTPPEVKYFSYIYYLGNRSVKGQRRQVFASLGDPINNLTINGGQQNPYNLDTVIIGTADSVIDNELRNILTIQGYPKNTVNTWQIPLPLTRTTGPLRMGFEKNSDDFSFLHRVAFCRDKSKCRDYFTGQGLTVLRITPRLSRIARPFIPVKDFTKRGDGRTEEQNVPGITKALSDLETSIKAKYSDENAFRGNPLPLDVTGFTCIEHNIPCLGDNWDAAYVPDSAVPSLVTSNNPSFLLSQNPKDFFIVAGINHKETGESTYSSISVYNSKKAFGVVSFSTESDILGSIDQYLPNNPYRKYLYAYKFARNCNGEKYCVSVPIDFPGIGLSDNITLNERAYLDPKTKVGPAYGEIIRPVFLHFTPK